MSWVYHRIRRFFYPDLYWTKKDIDEINAQAAKWKAALDKERS